MKKEWEVRIAFAPQLCGYWERVVVSLCDIWPVAEPSENKRKKNEKSDQ